MVNNLIITWQIATPATSTLGIKDAAYVSAKIIQIIKNLSILRPFSSYPSSNRYHIVEQAQKIPRG